MNRDITFCDLKSCEKKETCMRYEETHELGDSVFIWPKDLDSSTCEYYWPNDVKNNNKEK